MTLIDLIIGYSVLLMAIYLIYHTANATFTFLTKDAWVGPPNS